MATSVDGCIAEDSIKVIVNKDPAGTNGFAVPNACWDGRVNGKKQPTGTYDYWIKAKTICEDERFKKGVVILVAK